MPGKGTGLLEAVLGALGGNALDSIAFLMAFDATVITLACGILPFAWALKRRPHFGRRLGSLGAGVALLGICLWPAMPVANADPGRFNTYTAQLVFFSLFVVGCTLAVMFLFEASIWSALFCGTAGYTLQNFMTGIIEAAWLLSGTTLQIDTTVQSHMLHAALNLLGMAAVYPPFYRFFSRRISPDALDSVQNRGIAWLLIAVMFGVVGFDLTIKDLTGQVATATAITLRCFHGLMCVLTFSLEYELLVNRRLQIEREAEARVHAERERQYELSRANIEAINVKCHDIKHQIRYLADGGTAADSQALAELAREVEFYDSAVRTGNEALDTILTEKRLTCANEGITLSCVADGAALGFMRDADIYSFFGNALDNAIEAARQLEDPTLRSISLVVRQVAGVASVHVENRYAHEPVVAEDGTLLTSKDDSGSHGFGLRSMRLTVEGYGGTLATLVDREGRTFHVNAMVPLP